jgi:outer membrane protein assembly factor BamB
MHALRFVPVFAAAALCVSALGSDEVPLSNWSAPPFWLPAAKQVRENKTPTELGVRRSNREALTLPSSSLPFVAITPCRQFDSRGGSPLLNNTPLAVTLTGVPCGIPPTAQAASVNITVVDIMGAGGNGVFKVGTVSPPTMAWVNYPPTETQRGNAGVVPLTDAGTIVVQVNQGGGSVDFVIDVNGYYDGTVMTTQGVTSNPLQIALLKWYPANQSGVTFGPVSLPSALAFDGANVWVASQGSIPGTVTKFRANDGANLGTFNVGQGPVGLAFDGTNIWVTLFNFNLLTKLRASDGTYLGTFSVGTNPYGIAFDGANIWVANQNGANVTKLQASDGADLGTFSVGSSPTAVAFDGANIWVANMDGDSATKLRASDGANLGTFGVGSRPTALAFDGANIWVANRDSNNVTKLRASEGTVLGTFNAGQGPAGLAFDGANIWVANSGGNNVTKL